MTSFEQAISRSKLEYAEKYKSVKVSDLDMIQRYLGHKVEFFDNRKRAVIHLPTKELAVTIRE